MLIGDCKTACVRDAAVFGNTLPVTSGGLTDPAVSVRGLVADFQALLSFIVSKYVLGVLALWTSNAAVSDSIYVVILISIGYTLSLGDACSKLIISEAFNISKMKSDAFIIAQTDVVWRSILKKVNLILVCSLGAGLHALILKLVKTET